jgi:hypothetical protein
MRIGEPPGRGREDAGCIQRWSLAELAAKLVEKEQNESSAKEGKGQPGCEIVAEARFEARSDHPIQEWRFLEPRLPP